VMPRIADLVILKEFAEPSYIGCLGRRKAVIVPHSWLLTMLKQSAMGLATCNMHLGRASFSVATSWRS
jgi:hypothetical protein